MGVPGAWLLAVDCWRRALFRSAGAHPPPPPSTPPRRRDVLRASAREEFEAARAERDPEVVARLLVVGRDAVHRAAERFLAKRGELTGAGGAPGAPPGAPPTPKF